MGRRRASAMTWQNQPAPESRVGPEGVPQIPCTLVTSQAANLSAQPPLDTSLGRSHTPEPLALKVAKIHLTAQENGSPADLFTIALGTETISLLPFRNWGQLDLHKWTVRGRLPGTPAGLEVTPDHVKMAGETVLTSDPDGCAKLQKAFDEWLELEKSSLEHIRKKRQSPTIPAKASNNERQSSQAVRFRVEVDKRGQVHINCLQGAESLSTVGLTVQGFNGLFSQGLMRKPQALDIGALHDWVELDGQLCSFEHGNNDAAKLEKLLNEKYLPATALGQGKNIAIFANAASPTGFDIQFPVTVGGVTENRRRTLNDAALELLQEPTRCGVLQAGLIVKISPPSLIFKRKTADGGETYLDKNAQDMVTVTTDDGGQRLIDLSQPVNYTRLGVVEMTAVFNHPAVNRHSNLVIPPLSDDRTVSSTPVADQVVRQEEVIPVAASTSQTAIPPGTSAGASAIETDPVAGPTSTTLPRPLPAPPADLTPRPAEVATPKARLSTNRWLAPILAQPVIRFDWLTSLLYANIAERFGNSREGMIGPAKCWSVALGEVLGVEDPNFKGVFLTQKGGFGFLGQHTLLRFHKGVVFLGSRETVLEGIGVSLIAVGLDTESRLLFIVADEYRSRLGATDRIIASELTRLDAAGAVILTREEAIEFSRVIELVWTVPADQADPINPEAIENLRPAEAIIGK